MLYIVLLLLLLNIRRIITDYINEDELYDDEKIYYFLKFKVSYNEIDICSNGIAECNDESYVTLFSYNQCWNEGDISTEFPYLSELETLTIMGNEFQSCVKHQISENIFKLPKLKELNLEYFRISDIPQNINTNNSINLIDISDSVLEEFPMQFVKFQNLKKISLTNNTSTFLPKEFAEFPALEELELRNNTYKNKELVIPNKVKYLDVSNEGFTSLYKDNYNKELVSFICENDKITNDNFNEDIFDSLKNYKKLEYLNLKNNKLIKKIPSSIKELTSLKELDLDYSNIDEVSKEYFYLSKLQKNFVLKYKNSNNLASYKRCEQNNGEKIPCFDISEGIIDSDLFLKIAIPCFIALAFLIIVVIGVFAYIKIKKRNKFEKIRKKIIDNVTNEVEDSNLDKPDNVSYDNKNNKNDRNFTNSQVNLLVVDNDSVIDNDIINVNNSMDKNENNIKLPTYMESISQNNNYLRMAQYLDSGLRPPQNDTKQDITENIVDAQVVIPNPVDYYGERLNRKILLENQYNNNNRNVELQIDDDKNSFSNITNENIASRVEENNNTEIYDSNSENGNTVLSVSELSETYSLNSNTEISDSYTGNDIEIEPLEIADSVEQTNNKDSNSNNKNVYEESFMSDHHHNYSYIENSSDTTNTIDMSEQNKHSSKNDLPKPKNNRSLIKENSYSTLLNNNNKHETVFTENTESYINVYPVFNDKRVNKNK